MSTWTPEAIRQRVASIPYWHYAFDLGHGIITQPSHGDGRRQEQRLAYLFPPLLHLAGGSLAGLTVLDVGCNQGFWSIEAARAGALAVLGVEGRPEHVATARFVADVLNIANVDFETLNVFDPALAQRGPFDVVLCLGLLYHVDRPLELLERLRSLTRRWLVLDTSVVDLRAAVLHLVFEDPEDPRNVVDEGPVGDGLVAVPSREAVERMLWHVGFAAVWRVVPRSRDMPPAYRQGRRGAWVAAADQEFVPQQVNGDLLRAVPDNWQRRQTAELFNPLAAEPLPRFLREHVRQIRIRSRLRAALSSRRRTGA